jgi:hypothetical protein
LTFKALSPLIFCRYFYVRGKKLRDSNAALCGLSLPFAKKMQIALICFAYPGSGNGPSPSDVPARPPNATVAGKKGPKLKNRP